MKFINISSKTVVLSFFISICWVFNDINERFIIAHENVSKAIVQVETSQLKLPLVKSEFFLEMAERYKKYTTQIEIKEDVVGLKAEQQLDQKGELIAFFVDDYKLKLKAILIDYSSDSEPYTALIEVENIKTNKKQIKKFDNMSDIFSYKLNILSNTQVLLTKKYKEREQTIKLSMYIRTNKPNFSN